MKSQAFFPVSSARQASGEIAEGHFSSSDASRVNRRTVPGSNRSSARTSCSSSGSSERKTSPSEARAANQCLSRANSRISRRERRSASETGRAKPSEPACRTKPRTYSARAGSGSTVCAGNTSCSGTSTSTFIRSLTKRTGLKNSRRPFS